MPYLAMQDGTQIYYEDRGSGEPIVFCHGLTSSQRKIRAFIEEFRGEYRCIAYDHRGHGASSHTGKHMNVKTLAQDLNELLDYLNLDAVTLVGHSLGAATIFSYIGQFGCARIKKIVCVDMTPCASNRDWKGGLARGQWSEEDFLADIDRYFDDSANANWIVLSRIMNPPLGELPPKAASGMIHTLSDTCSCDSFTLAGLWYSVYRTDNRPVLDTITVPFLHVLPETPICGMEAIDYMRDHIKGTFVVAEGLTGTTHSILTETPKDVADKVKVFLKTCR